MDAAGADPAELVSNDPSMPDDDLLGWTCETCGDTYTAHQGKPPQCPSCGGESARIAAEPFL